MYFVKILLIDLVIRKSPQNSKHCRFGHLSEQGKIVTRLLVVKYYISSANFELHGPYLTRNTCTISAVGEGKTLRVENRREWRVV